MHLKMWSKTIGRISFTAEVWLQVIAARRALLPNVTTYAGAGPPRLDMVV